MALCEGSDVVDGVALALAAEEVDGEDADAPDVGRRASVALRIDYLPNGRSV